MIREATASDASEIARIYAPLVAGTPVSFETEPPSPEEIARRIATCHEWLVSDDGATLQGYAYAAAFHARAAYRWSIEISVYVDEAARGKGVGKALLAALVERVTARGFVNAFAGIALPNPASVALFESFGFDRIALQRSVGFKLGRWHDVGWWQKHLTEPPVPPPQLS